MDYDATRLAPALRQHDRLVTTFKRTLGKAGLLAFSERIGLAGTAHACGTLVTGMDPQRSVVDASGRVHGMKALYVVDGSILPRSSRVNPSLTIYSWSLRVARALALSLQEAQAERREAVLS
jgi:choline dehydrogenase-like flavoprotein